MSTSVITRSTGHSWITAATGLGFAVVQLDVTVLNVALPRMGTAFATDIAALQWVVDAYSLSFAALLLSAGVLSDRLGARRVYIAGFAAFAAASAACGLAGGVAMLVAARAVQGIGAALLVPASLALLNDATRHDAALRARAVGLWTAAGGVSIAAGPILGGLLLASLGWRAIFLVNLPLCALGVALTLHHLPPAPRRADAPHLDLAGQALAALALAALVGGVIETRGRGIGSPPVLAAFAVGVAAAAALVRVEVRSPAPMLPPSLLRRHGFGAAVLFGVAMNFGYYGVIFLLSLYLQRVRGYSALQAGLAYLPLTATFVLSNTLSGAVAGRFGTKTPMILGALLGAAGFALLLPLGARSPYGAMVAGFALIPFGMGLAVPAMTTTVLAAVPRERAGTASAVLNAARQAGGAAGVALFGALAGSDVAAGLHLSVAGCAALGVAAAGLAAFAVPTARR